MHPLDRVRSIQAKIGFLVAVTATFGSLLTWLGLNNGFGPAVSVPVAVVLSLALSQVLARRMTAPLREMTAAAQAMAGGDYSQRVHATGRDEVGLLAATFNTMAEDLGTTDMLRREMVANVSHELRTPVTALQAQLENIVDGVTEADPASMKVALAQTERLGRLVTYLLDLSRVEAGAVGLDLSDVPLRDFLREAADRASLVGTAKMLVFRVKVTPPDLVIRADAERLHQVIANLLHNAVRHSPADEEIILVATQHGEIVVIEVIDLGPGIAPAQRQVAFERFARGNSQAQTGQVPTGGTGIGLAIVRWAVGLHGGTIEVADTPTGCTMRLTLPMHHPPSGPPTGVTPYRETGDA
ncbi:HAMP domain-containing sensor histidine kinase [Pengzhenrongella frigida]|uniref:HAMP domain-containing sensor histidine kinase n=1 Tax=Pengzhenrongella frigida TaxID=1259133 RepID=UPI001F5E0CDA|nr:HAMP domain-containing sensor histidine kinase [Cellulomonas sp. HLT2-17]